MIKGIYNFDDITCPLTALLQYRTISKADPVYMSINLNRLNGVQSYVLKVY